MIWVLRLLLLVTIKAGACPFPKYLQHESFGPKDSKNQASVGLHDQELVEVFEEESKQLFYNYTEGHLDTLAFQDCDRGSPTLQKRLIQSFPRIFLTEAASALSKHSHPHVAAFGKRSLDLIRSGRVLPMSLRFHPVTSERPAGFDRQTKGLFFHLSEIEPKLWNLYFIHELSHAMDDQLQAAIIGYANPVLQSAAIQAVKRHPDKMTEEDQSALSHYLRAGADRGLFAEFRAWVVTTYLYPLSLSRDESVLLEVPWLRPVLGQNPPAHNDLNSYKVSWWKYLKKNFPLVREGFFSNPIVQKVYDEMIQNIEPTTESFGSLAEFL